MSTQNCPEKQDGSNKKEQTQTSTIIVGAFQKYAARGLKERQQFAYHGSPHNFKEFNLSKVGTGEGIQGFGWGQYFSGTEEIAEKYRVALSARRKITYKDVDITNNANLVKAAKHLIKKGGDKDAAIKELKEPAEKRPSVHTTLPNLEKMDVSKIRIENTQGQLYQITIPEGDIDRMLNWDRVVSEQEFHVKRALSELVKELYKTKSLNIYLENLNSGFNALAGKDIYMLTEHALMAGKLKIPEDSPIIISGKKAASQYLASLGIPGLLYFDKRSREKGEGTHNYVVWDPRLIDKINEGQIEMLYPE